MAEAFIAYIIVMSVILYIFMFIDKKRAIKHQWRISEKTLLLLGFFGGAIGGVFAMYSIRHKTRKNAFAFSYPILSAIHIFIMVKLLKG